MINLNHSEQTEFLKLVRTGPGYICFKPIAGSFFERQFQDYEEALRLIAQYGANSDVYVSMATYGTGVPRSKENSEQVCALWLDIDAHGNGSYSSVSKAEDALSNFLEETGIPEPNIVNLTGYGVHAIWPLSDALTRDAWLPVATDLQVLAGRMGLDADRITADSARILRVPGTLNFRDPAQPRLALPRRVEPDLQSVIDIHKAIRTALEKRTVRSLASAPKSILTLNEAIPETPANVAIVTAMLAAIDPDVQYDIWRNIIWAVASTGWSCARGLAEGWSKTGRKWSE